MMWSLSSTSKFSSNLESYPQAMLLAPAVAYLPSRRRLLPLLSPVDDHFYHPIDTTILEARFCVRVVDVYS